MPPEDPSRPSPLPPRVDHILLIHQSFASLDEAGGTRHHELARFLAANGCRVTIITGQVSYLSGKTLRGHRWVEREEGGEGISILRTWSYPALHRGFFHRVLAFISFMLSSFIAGLGVREVDLVWGTSPPIFQGVTALLLARLKGVPFLFEVRDLWPAFAVQVGVLRQPLLIRASEALERFLYRHADRVMVNSPGFIPHVQSRGARCVDLVPNGADPAMFHPDQNGEAFRLEHQLGDRFAVLYAGAHGLSNDLGVVLEAASILQDDPRLVFVLVGDGKEKSTLMDRASSMGLANVLFLPPVPKSQMSPALSAADACLAILKPIPLYETTFPNKVFDYMAAGRPVVLAIGGVIRAIVESAGAGVAISPGDPAALADAVRCLASLPDRGRSMGAAGRELILSTYSREKTAAQLVQLINEMGRKHAG